MTTYIIYHVGNARLLARNPLWYTLLSHFQERNCIVEGPLNNLVPSMLNLPRPKISSTDKRLTFTALGSQGGGGYDSLDNTPVTMGMAPMTMYASPQQQHQQQIPQHINPTGEASYYARSWGSHPDMVPFDLRSQNSTTASMNASLSNASINMGGNNNTTATTATTTSHNNGSSAMMLQQMSAPHHSHGHGRGAADSRHDSRYQFDNVSVDGSLGSYNSLQ
jgi:hypothetical protein